MKYDTENDRIVLIPDSYSELTTALKALDHISKRIYVDTERVMIRIEASDIWEQLCLIQEEKAGGG